MNDLLSIAKFAAISGGEAIIRSINSFKTSYKSDNTPLTTADLASNEAIFKILDQTGIKICSEENILNDDSKTYWLIDPLDGTKDFIEGIKEFCVCIALIKNKRPTLGVMYDPIKKEIFYSTTKVYLNDTLLETKINSSNFIVGRHTNIGIILKTLMAKFNSKMLYCGSAIKFKYLFSGEAGIFLRLGKSSIWDIAAADIMLKNLGGKIIDLHTNKEIVYDLKHIKNNHFVALNRFNLEKLEEIKSCILNNKIN